MPHGSDALNPLYVMDPKERAALAQEAEKLPSVVVSSAAAANAVMMGEGYFNPLTGYMNLGDALRVADEMRTGSGLFWPVPILNTVKDASAVQGKKRIALRDPNVEGNPVIAVMDLAAVEQATPAQTEHMTQKIFRTMDPTLTLVVLTVLFLASCKGGNRQAEADQLASDSLSKVLLATDVKEVLYPLPTPFEMTKMLNDIGAT